MRENRVQWTTWNTDQKKHEQPKGMFVGKHGMRNLSIKPNDCQRPVNIKEIGYVKVIRIITL